MIEQERVVAPPDYGSSTATSRTSSSSRMTRASPTRSATTSASRGYTVEHVADGAAGLHAAQALHYDLLIVDRMLPELDGLAVIETLRAEQVRTPVLVLSALGAVDDRMRGLKAGGDDYLTKPFALGELTARIEALLRRPVETARHGAAGRRRCRST